jgi:hypothetical protein
MQRRVSPIGTVIRSMELLGSVYASENWRQADARTREEGAGDATDQRDQDREGTRRFRRGASALSEYYADLRLLEISEEGARSQYSEEEMALRSGESVKVLFVVGNETQAQYDEVLTCEIKTEWPGVKNAFRAHGMVIQLGA